MRTSLADLRPPVGSQDAAHFLELPRHLERPGVDAPSVLRIVALDGRRERLLQKLSVAILGVVQ